MSVRLQKLVSSIDLKVDGLTVRFQSNPPVESTSDVVPTSTPTEKEDEPVKVNNASLQELKYAVGALTRRDLLCVLWHQSV